jgi:hypothetical protein
MSYVRLVGLAKENRLIKMHALRNFKIISFQLLICDQPIANLKNGDAIVLCWWTGMEHWSIEEKEKNRRKSCSSTTSSNTNLTSSGLV